VLPSSVLAQQTNAAAPKSKAATQSSPISTSTAPTETVAAQSNSAAAVVASPSQQNVLGISFLSQLESEIIAEINLARTEPQKYAAFVEEFKKYYSGANLSIPGRQALVTAEGLVAVDEAISFLRAAKPLPAFQISKGVCSAAADHVRDLVTKGITGHKGSDGSTPNARLDRYGRWDMAVGENIVYDVGTARQIVIGFLIDDGVANRGHRKNIFDSKYRIAGISISNSSRPRALGVINFTVGFTEKQAGLK
jgi:uncharacterized protein YkwD